MQKARKQARPPPDDPAQSERFVKAAAEMIGGDDGGALFERAMEQIAKPAGLPAEGKRAIISKPKAVKKKAAGAAK